MPHQPLHVVLIEDDEVDVEAVSRLIAQERLPFRLTTFANGQVAQQALLGSFGQSLQYSPFLILLDLNMPRMNGHEFLDWLRGSSFLRTAVVFVMTTSDVPTDIHRAYAHNVAGYLVKQQLGQSFKALAHILTAYAGSNTFPC